MRSLRMLVICFVVMMLSLLLLRLASEMVTPSAQYPAPDMPWQGQPGGLRQSPWNGNQKYLEPF